MEKKLETALNLITQIHMDRNNAVHWHGSSMDMMPLRQSVQSEQFATSASPPAAMVPSSSSSFVLRATDNTEKYEVTGSKKIADFFHDYHSCRLSNAAHWNIKDRSTRARAANVIEFMLKIARQCNLSIHDGTPCSSIVEQGIPLTTSPYWRVWDNNMKLCAAKLAHTAVKILNTVAPVVRERSETISAIGQAYSQFKSAINAHIAGLASGNNSNVVAAAVHINSNVPTVPRTTVTATATPAAVPVVSSIVSYFTSSKSSACS